MVDKDGNFTYSNVVVLKLDDTKHGDFLVFPNPVIGHITLIHPKADAGSAIKIITADGKQIAVYYPAINASQTSLDASRLIPGQYFISYVSKGKVVTTSFVK